MSDAEVADEIWRVTGQRVSRGTIWKLRTGQTLHPTFDLIEGLARALGVPTDWFSGKMDAAEARELEAQVMLLAELRDNGVTSVHLHTMRDADPGTRSAIIKILELAARPPVSEPQDGGRDGDA
jgi:transcriptional regulator with XRE-family HTH domain